MAKEFYTSGIGSAQTLNPSDESKIKIYDDKAAADLDLANIEENEIIATKAGESEGVVEVVDTVEENNPNAVSSGAVYDKITEKTSWKVLRVFTTTGSATLPEDFEDVLVVETNAGSIITTSGRTLYIPRIAITGSSGQTANYWLAGTSAGNVSTAGVVTISTLSSGYVKVYYR